MKWTVRNKMLAGFSGVTALVAVLGIATMYEITALRNIGDTLGNNTVKSIELLGRLNGDTSDHRMLHLMHIDAPNQDDKLRIDADLQVIRNTLDQHVREYEPLIASDEEKRAYDDFVKAHAAYREEGLRFLAKSRMNQNDDARKDYFVAKQRYDTSQTALQALIGVNQRQGREAVEHAAHLYAEARNIVIFVTLLVAIVAFSFGLWLSGNIASPLTKLAEVFRKIAAGDSKGAADDLKAVAGGSDRALSGDEVGSLILSAREMEQTREKLTLSLRDGVTRLASGSAQIATTAKEYTETSSAQASAVAEVSTTVEEIKQTSEVAASGAREVAITADEAAKNGMIGRERLNEAVNTMRVIESRVGAIASQILDLSERVEQIGTIVDAVSDLAEQSNLLAVNASIEAAKAGEHGRGFSVVASEVRSLAEQSKRATLQIRGILSQIQKATQAAVMATEEGTKRSEDGRHVIEAMRAVIDNLAGVLDDSSTKARQISAASAQQASGIGQIATALASIAKSARDNASGVRQLEAAVVDIERLTATLRTTSERL